MQLSDAEIREILIRRKKAKIRKQKRRRHRMLIALLLIIVLIFAFIKLKGSKGKGTAEDEKAADKAAAAQNRGVIFIDPGHGGMDSGSDDDKDRYEKDDTLKLGLAVRDKLQALGFKVAMSRTEDELVDRTERGKMANKAGAVFFVSMNKNLCISVGFEFMSCFDKSLTNGFVIIDLTIENQHQRFVFVIHWLISIRDV